MAGGFYWGRDWNFPGGGEWANLQVIPEIGKPCTPLILLIPIYYIFVIYSKLSFSIIVNGALPFAWKAKQIMVVHQRWEMTSDMKIYQAVASLKKTLYPFLWVGFNCLNATKPLRADNLLFTNKSPEIPGTHLIKPRKMKGWVHPGASQ